jgi:hypothetical protein
MSKRQQGTQWKCETCGFDAGMEMGWNETPLHCEGGTALWRRADLLGKQHHSRVLYFCQWCNQQLGCRLCCQMPQEIICGRCHEWGMLAGIKQHGRLIAQELKESGMEAHRIIQMVERGSLTHIEGERLIFEMLHPGDQFDPTESELEEATFRAKQRRLHQTGARIIERQHATAEGRQENRDIRCDCEHCRRYWATVENNGGSTGADNLDR